MARHEAGTDVVAKFGGLNLRDDSEELAFDGATDLNNVVFDRPGRIGVRAGYSSFRALGFAVQMGAQSHITGSVVVGGTSNTALISSGATAYTLAQTGYDAVRFGNITFVATDNGLYRTGMASFTATTTPLGAATRHIGVTPWDSRVVVTGSGLVYFSNAGDGTVWGTNNFVGVGGPASGASADAITGVAAWGGYLIVGRGDKLYVFYGTSTDTSGNPIFNYRTIDAGSAPVDPTPGIGITMVAARDGVYYLAQDGVYRTRGDTPTKVSGPLDPYFRGETLYHTSIATGGTFTNACIGYADERLYVCPNSSVALTFVYDIARDVWTAYDWAITALFRFGREGVRQPPLMAIGNTVFKHDIGLTTDNGTAIASRYQSGFFDFGDDYRKWIGEIRAWGMGSPTLSIFADHGSTDALASTLTLGTSPVAAMATARRSPEGKNYAFKLSAASGAWSVNKLTFGVRR